MVLVQTPQEEGHPAAVSLQEGDAQIRMALQDAPSDHADHGQHHLHGMAGRMDHLEVRAEAVAHLWQVRAEPFVEAERHPEPFQLLPQRLEIAVVPVAPLDRVGPHEHGPATQILDRPAGLLHRVADVVGRDHPGPEQPSGVGLAVVVQPVVVGARDRRGEGGVQVIDGLGEEPA